MLPAPGQGALAIEVRETEFVNPDTATLFDPEISQPVRTLGEALIAADHFETHLEVTAERRLLRRLEAGCAAPIGAYATVISGAGPSILTLCPQERVADILAALEAAVDCQHQVVSVLPALADQ